MILRELYYFDKSTMEPIDDDRYDSSEDDSIMKLDDTRKTRLTLKAISRVRKAEDMHRKEKQEDLVQVRTMYGIAAQAEAGAETI